MTPGARQPSAAVQTRLTYIGPMTERPRYYTRDSSRNVITRDRRTVLVEDARQWMQPPSLAREGFALMPHRCPAADFGDPEELARIYLPEIEQLLGEVCGADHVAISGHIVLRLNELPRDSAGLNILRPARFVHIDINDATAAALAERVQPKDIGRSVRRRALYTIWRVLSPPPQDIPLAVCDARSVLEVDLVDADAITDTPGKGESSSVVVAVRYNPRHRWSYFSNMHRDEVLVFKSHDSDRAQPQHVPHSAFKDSSCPSGVIPRMSIEVRATAFWFGS